LVESGSKEAVFSNLDVGADEGGGFPRDINQDGAGPVPDGGRSRVRGFSNPDRGVGGGPHAGSWVGMKVCNNEIKLAYELELPFNACLDAPKGMQGVGDIGTGL